MLYEDDENTKYRSSVYNATIEIVEAPGTIDVKQYVPIALVIVTAQRLPTRLRDGWPAANVFARTHFTSEQKWLAGS